MIINVMNKTILFLIVTLLFSVISASSTATSRWGADYFPNVPLTTQDGDVLYFFDDLIKDRVVAINFIYTSCPDICPLETAKLVKVQNILGERFGSDVFFFSISIDPENDTPERLREYKERFGANWPFLTGKKADVDQLRKKLGLYVPEIQDGSNNHNVTMIIGNQTTGRWMKRSPFENPYVLADQLGNWLTGWKTPSKVGSYASAPALRSITPGERLFRTRCQSCHTVTGNELPSALGPDLFGVVERRDMKWLLRWLKEPDKMLEEKDPIAMELFERYNQLAMPNMRLTLQDATALIDYLNEEQLRQGKGDGDLATEAPEKAILPISDVVAVMDAWIREAHPEALVNAGYMTLINTNQEAVRLVNIESDLFETVEMHEMAVVDGLMTMRQLNGLLVPANGSVKLSPGGKHLMLKGPKQEISITHNVDVILTFESGETQAISLKVAAR